VLFHGSLQLLLLRVLGAVQDRAATGSDLTLTDLMSIGEKGWNLKRAINNKLGLTRANDKLPKGLLRPYEDDTDNYVPDFASMLEAYYNIRGWDRNSGFPGDGKLSELGLNWVSKDLKVIRLELEN
jgi:aldehyde:ferredoxin oxidoreductase